MVDLNHVWVDSRLRATAQRRIELPVLDTLADRPRGGRVLELGCGRRGTGVRLALSRLAADRVHAIDLEARNVEQGCRATADLGDRVRVQQGDARSLDADDDTYDLVLAFHVLHHTPGWRAVLPEAARVLRRRACDPPPARRSRFGPGGPRGAADLRPRGRAHQPALGRYRAARSAGFGCGRRGAYVRGEIVPVLVRMAPRPSAVVLIVVGAPCVGTASGQPTTRTSTPTAS